MAPLAARPDLTEMLEDGSRLFTEQLATVDESQWSNPTVCADWSVEDLVEHVVSTARGAEAILTGLPRQDAEGALLDRWAAAHAGLLEAVARAAPHETHPVPADSPHAKLPFYACDFTIHAWDLSVALSEEIELPDGWVTFMDEFFHSLPPESLRRPRAFADPVEPRPGAGRTRTLMALPRSRAERVRALNGTTTGMSMTGERRRLRGNNP